MEASYNHNKGVVEIKAKPGYIHSPIAAKVCQTSSPTDFLLFMIFEKLEEIKCGLVDIENNTENIGG